MLWNIYNVYCPSHYITILESAKRIYRSYRSHCTEFQRIPSVSEVHVFRWAAQSFVLLGYEKSYLNRRVNGVFMPPNNHAIDATFEHMIPHFSLCSIYRSKCIPRPCVCTNPSIFDRIGEIWPSPSTPRSVPFGTTRFNSLHVLSDSGQSWMDIQVCPLIFSW